MPKRNVEEVEQEMEDEQEGDQTSDVFEILKSDHRKVQDLFARFEDADKRGRAAIAEEALSELEVHAKLEEELVYPAFREVIEEEELLDQAREEHHVARLLIKELHKMSPGDEAFAPKFKVLGEIVTHHIEEEEGQVFPQVQEGELDGAELGEEVMKRKQKLMNRQEAGGKRSGGQKRKKAA